MRGRLQLRIMRRLLSNSWRFQDKYSRIDRLDIYCIINKENGKKYFKVFSLLQQFQPYIISRDELGFVKLLFIYYGAGDYYIQFWGHGKSKGLRNFADLVISPEKKFFRRRISFSINPTTHTKMSESTKGDFIGRYMKTKSPGKWYSF